MSLPFGATCPVALALALAVVLALINDGACGGGIGFAAWLLVWCQCSSKSPVEIGKVNAIARDSERATASLVWLLMVVVVVGSGFLL